jgi:Complex I intermediate-associated protein 30 (CIA30)
MFFDAIPPAHPRLKSNTLFDFRKPTESLRALWGVLNDGVMGGRSTSTVELEPGGLAFSGVVSTENSGGFASIRTRNFEPALDLSAYSGFRLSVKGDGQRYKVFLRDRTAWDSVAYAYSFDTLADQWTSVQIPFAAMKPVQRAKVIQAQPLDSAQIASFQLMLSKFEYDSVLNPHFTPGSFRLLVQKIEVY